MVDPPGVEGGNGFQASASPYLSNPSEPEPVRVKPQTVARTNERPVYRLEDLDFVDEEAFGDGSYGLEPSPETKRPEASAPEASASETTQPVKASPFTPVQYDTPSPVRRQEKKVQKNTVWNNAYQYESAPLEKPRRGRRMALIGIMTGCFLVLSYLAFLRWQSRDVENYQVDFQAYENILIRADSLFSLAQDVAAISNEEKASELFNSALELYFVAQTFKAGDEVVQRRIDEINGILTQPPSSELDEKASLALISRGDSLQRSADAMMLQGDSVRARALYMEARSQYLAVLDQRPEDSLANARVQQANDRIMRPFKSEPDPVTTVAQPAVSNLQQRENLFEQFKTQGDSAFRAQNLEESRRKYLEALALQPNDAYVEQQLKRISQQIAESARTSLYRRHMGAGEKLVAAGRLAEARREYELALENKANDSEALRALDRIDDELETRSRNEQMYVTERTRGDVFLEQGNYQPALQSYEAALTRKPGDSYAQSKIDEINRVFSARNEQEAELPDGMIDENGIYNFTEDPPVLVGGRDVLQSRLRYPALAIEAGVEGRVSVRMAVDETGKMLNPTVIKALGYGCDDEVLRVIRGARFEPARVGGQPVKAWHTLYFDFKLEDQ
jgi:TonB family protein